MVTVVSVGLDATAPLNACSPTSVTPCRSAATSNLNELRRRTPTVAHPPLPPPWPLFHQPVGLGGAGADGFLFPHTVQTDAESSFSSVHLSQTHCALALALEGPLCAECWAAWLWSPPRAEEEPREP